LISGLPGDIEYVMCLQEAIAVAAATGYALIGDRPAVVNLHALPGVGHAMGALHGAKLMHAPIVAIAGQQDSAHLFTEPLLSGDLVATARPATRWATQVNRPADVAPALERAFRTASTPPTGPVLVAVPMDFWDQPAGVPVNVAQPEAPEAALTVVDRVIPLLEASTHGALVTGDRINDRQGWNAALAVAETFDLAVYAAPIGFQPGFPTDHPRFRGNLPLVTSRLRASLDQHDVVVVAGAPIFTTYLFDGSLPIPDGTQFVLLSDDPEEVARSPVDVVVFGAPGSSLARLTRGGVPESYEPKPGRAPAPLARLDLASVMQHVALEIPSDAILIDESMTAGPQVRSALRVREPRQYLRTSNGVLGTGLPATIGAALSRPECPVVAFVGDGAVMFAPQALWTAAQHNLSITILVLNNGGYESLRGYERVHLQQRTSGSPSFDITGIDLVAIAEAMGVGAVRVTEPRDLVPGVKRAINAEGPTLLDIRLES
jgi:benzoylformate decarboxylase